MRMGIEGGRRGGGIAERLWTATLLTAGLLTVGLLTTGIARAAETDDPPLVASPLAPSAAVEAFVLDPAVTIELVASEPQVVDPVAIQFAADGSLWVVEMGDYPHGPAEGEPPRSRIKRLFDRDGDGHYETATVFADRLLFVTGVLPYRDGLIVTLAGKIMFFADRNGDGQADFRETWFSGFAEQNSQLRANRPTFGPDGYVYISNGLRGGQVVAERPQWKGDGKPLTITGFDFRFHPETGDFSTVNGHGQFGMSFDDYGRRFAVSNRNPCMHIVLEDRYLKQNPLYGVRKVVHDVCPAGEDSRLYPISRAWTTSTLHANQFTAACGVLIYRGDALPAEFYGNAYTCDPTGNLVHRETLAPLGPTFQGTSPYEQKEFLASPDTWFRPVNLAHGPDGALYVVDMYRAVIEHPDFMPTELKTRPDLLQGTDRGRIYRVTTSGSSPAAPDLTTTSVPERLAALNHPNSFRRELALRQLVEDPPAGVSAEAVLSSVTAPLPFARSSALHLLQQWGQLPKSAILAGLADPSPEVRETALVLAENHLDDDALVTAMLPLIGDESARVRFQALQSLTLRPADDRLLSMLLPVSLRDGGDAWMRSAILTAAREQSAALLAQLLTAEQPEAAADQAGLTLLCADLAGIVAAPVFDDARSAVWQALSNLPDVGTSSTVDELRWAVLDGLGQGLRRRGTDFVKSPGFPSNLSLPLTQWLSATVAAAEDVGAPVSTRLVALRTARYAPPQHVAEGLLKISLQDADLAIQQAAFETLATLPQPELATPLLARFGGAAPSARRGILDALLSNESRTEQLVIALEAGEIKPTELDPVRSQRLTNHRNTALRDRARKVLAAATAERQEVLTAYAPALALKADPLKGRLIFEKQCVTCHRVGTIGVNVGPDIADSRTKTPDVLLTAILDPNRAIDNNYFGYTVVTEEGKVLTGIITAETSSSITLRQPEGKEETILRSDIDELRNTGLSLMPVGFEKNITPQQMADLISFLKNWRYLDGAVPAEGLGSE